MELSLKKIAPPVIFAAVGSILVVIAATGVVPIGNPQPSIDELAWRIGLATLGILLALAGPWLVWQEMFGPKSTRSPRGLSEQVAIDVATHLRQNTDWASEALDRARIRPRGQTIFTDRFGHFREEKKFIAGHFVPLLLKRCRVLVEGGKNVCLLIDSGTTLYPFFERLGRETVHCHTSGEKWLERLTIATNNLPGVEALMETGRINPINRYSPLAVECRLFPGILLPIYSAVTGQETNDALERLRTEAGSDTVFIGLVTGNWIRLRRSAPVCPLPLARGIGHPEFKQTLIDNSDEVFVVTPLGKIFVDIPHETLNDALEFRPNHPNPDKRAYQEVHIGNQKAATVRIVSTYREPERVLFNLGMRVRILLDVDDDTVQSLLREFPGAPTAKVPHILYPFDRLPDDWYLQYETEFPHEHTRREDFTKKYFWVPRASSQ